MLASVVGVAAVLLAGCGAPQDPTSSAAGGAAAKTFEWKMVTTWPKGLPGLGTASENLAKEINRMSAGRLRITIYAAGEMVPAFGVFDAVSEGAAEMGHGASYYWRGQVPIAALFTTVPFGMNAQETNAWLNHAGGLDLWREVYAPHNLRPFPSGNTGVQMAGWFNREINSLSDLAGLKFRTPGLGGEVMARAGSTPVLMPVTEVFTAMQTGNIDATEWIGPYNDLALGLYKVAKYYYYPGWQEPGTTLELVINTDAWNTLPPDLQAIVENAARSVGADVLDDFTFHNQEALRILLKDHNVELRRLPDVVLDRLRELSNDVMADVAGDDDLSKRVLASYVDFMNRVRTYNEITEQAFLGSR